MSSPSGTRLREAVLNAILRRTPPESGRRSLADLRSQYAFARPEGGDRGRARGQGRARRAPHGRRQIADLPDRRADPARDSAGRVTVDRVDTRPGIEPERSRLSGG